MPLYEYRCNNCGEEIERIVKYDTNVMCNKCGEKMERKTSIPGGFVLKGDGFAGSNIARRKR